MTRQGLSMIEIREILNLRYREARIVQSSVGVTRYVICQSNGGSLILNKIDKEAIRPGSISRL